MPPLPRYEKAALHGFPASEPLGNEDRALECASRSKETAEDQKRRLQRPIARKCSRSELAKEAFSSPGDRNKQQQIEAILEPMRLELSRMTFVADRQ